jgi:SPP1 gp7 family putative phage head morphogenesis protein
MSSNANTAIYDKSVDRAAMIRLYEQSVANKLNTTVDSHKNDVTKLVIKHKGKLTPEFKKDLIKENDKFSSNLYNQSSRSLLDLFKAQTDYMFGSLSNVIGNIWTTKKPARAVGEDIVLKKPLYNNIVLENGWKNITSSERKRVELLIRKSISQGKTETQVAEDIFKSKIFNITKNQALGLSRTAITSVYAQADHQIYEANKDVLIGWQYVSVLDSRTSDTCVARDGKIYRVDQTDKLPPAHWHCRSTTIPIVKKYDDLLSLENIAQIRKRNLKSLTQKQIDFYDGQSPLKESYDAWLRRQPQDIQLKHLGDLTKLELFRSNQLTLDQFSIDGRELSIKNLRQITESNYGVPGDTRRFVLAKEKLQTIKLGASRPEDFYTDDNLVKSLKDYYLLQAGELDGILSYTNYRGALIHTKRATRQRVLNSPPTEDQLKFNPVTKQYEDSRMYQPSPAALNNNLRLVNESDVLKEADKEFINKFSDSLEMSMGVNERAVVVDNLRIVFTRYRNNLEPWNNFKAVLNSQIKFDVMNTSDFIETQLRRDSNLLSKLSQMEYYDTVLGATSLDDLGEKLIDNIFEMRDWEYTQAPKIARKLRNILDVKIPLKIKLRLDDADLKEFYLRFARRLSLADNPDRDQFAIALGRDLYNLANYKGSRNEWYKLGVNILDDAKDKGFYELETFGVQKRRMKSRIGGRYFGPYYDALSINIRIVDKNILKYAELNRKVEVGMRVPVTDRKRALYVRPGYKTYFTYDNKDTGIPIMSHDSMSYFPVEMIDDDMANALNWAGQSEFNVDKDFYNFIEKLLFFKDDKGKAEYYDNLNHYRKHITARGDSYERFKTMKWLVDKDQSFSNNPFLDHRSRIYERGFIGPQAGETFRPFLSTAKTKKFSVDEFYNLQDQIGSFLGGLSDELEGRFNSLSVLGRQKIAEKWREELIKIGNHMRRAKPNDIRAVLESKLMLEVDGEDQGKVLRFAIELAKINDYLEGNFSKSSLVKLKDYNISLALEQDASSSGAQIIALTTRNKQLAELSNVIPTNQKKRLYDEIAASTFSDPRFQKLNERLGLTEKDLRKASKAQNMVTFYGAGERTGVFNVEGKLSKILSKNDGRLVVKAADRDTVLSAISARMARYQDLDPEIYDELKSLRQDVKDIFNKGLKPGDEIISQLYFLDPKTKDFVEKLTRQYDDIVTPEDFALIAGIMSENLRQQVPILKEFTRFLGRLAEDYVINTKPSEAFFDWKAISKLKLLGPENKGKKFHPLIAEVLGLNPKEPITEKILKRFSWWNPNSTFSDLLFGVKESKFRKTGAKFGEVEIAGLIKLAEFQTLYPNKLPKNWTQIPWVNFDGKVLEQKFTQTFEERLRYKNEEGQWITNIIQVDQKTSPSWWEELINKDNKINDIVDAQKARTAYAVNGNHSNDATLVKQFHLWGKSKNVSTATIHDAFFTNAADMLEAKRALRKMYAATISKNIIKKTLDEMLARGLPRELYDKYLNEAIDIGLIPVPGRSKIGGRLMTIEDILTEEDILKELPKDFSSNFSWYGIG